jgi:hypothetical protein
MTDKQIIIDGCDVSECSSFDKKTGHCLTGFRTDEEPFCNCFTCYYKQLKAKEQKLEKIKAYIQNAEWGILDPIYEELLKIFEE